MIRLACKIPKEVTLACSGGKDSMSALSFLLRGRRKVTVAYYNHGTDHGHEAQKFLEEFCKDRKIKLLTEECNVRLPSKVSKEAFWREQRYNFLSKIAGPIITAHHLDDAVEWWIFSSLRGKPSLMPIERADVNVIRPFLHSSKEALHRHISDLPFVKDPSNSDIKFARNYIRHRLGPLCLEINPGLQTTIRNLYKDT